MLAHSPYLDGLKERYGAPDDGTALAVIDDVAAPLTERKARFNLGWSHLALTTDTPFPELGLLQSAFAEAALDAALASCWAQAKLPGAPTGLFVLGLGKLGGHDLNFSSDIDLIAYFDETFPVSQARGRAHIAGQIMKRLTQVLQPRAGAPIYRVDWRLRPEASVSGLAMSASRARDFYFFRALPWHRLAMMKARVVGGDRMAGARFLAELSPYIWRQNLDFRTIDQLAELKTRINLEHPGLRAEREAREPIGSQPLGFNVKLGTGGIREIEFVANAQQLIWGGKAYTLRKTNTLAAIRALEDGGWLEDGAQLQGDYRALRRLENALQMMRNGQEHVLPGDVEGWAPIAALLGRAPDALLAETTERRRRVHARFADMFDEPDATRTRTPVPAPALESDAQRILSDWRAGFRRYGARNQRLGPLADALAARVAQAPDPDRAVARIDAYLGQLSRSEQYLSLLAANPSLLGALVEPLLHSPHMTVLLEQSPHIIDTFLSPVPPTGAFVLAEADYETRLERLRRFVNEGLFQSYHGFLQTGDAAALARALTALAEAAVETSLTIARDDLGAPDLAISVLGLGKLGEARMAPQSDLDLVFLFDDDVDRDLAAKAVRRLRTILTTPLREGIAYELDMRLRPSGRSGPPAVTLSAFARHHDEAARNWEHIALVPARVVAGDAALGARVEIELRDILARPRDREQLLADARHMWGLLKDERIRDVAPDRLSTKLRTGGLMQADFWGAVGRLTGGEAMDSLRVSWTALLYWERLLGLTGEPVSDVPEGYRSLMPGGLADNQATLESEVKAVTDLYAGAPSASMERVRWT